MPALLIRTSMLKCKIRHEYLFVSLIIPTLEPVKKAHVEIAA
jgi:hypothetical protein